MPPKASAKSGAGPGEPKQPTAQEALLFYTVIKNMKGKPDIDWAGVAADSGFKNPETAKVRYGQVKRKLGLDSLTAANKGKSAIKDENAVGENGLPTTPSTARTKKTTTPGTGAGVKKTTGRVGSAAAKRGTTTGAGTSAAGGRNARKAKSEAIVKMEENSEAAKLSFDFEETDADADAEVAHGNHDDDDLLNAAAGTPTKLKPKAQKRLTTTGPSTAATDTTSAKNDNALEYADFPTVLPEAVLERRAILVRGDDGKWTDSPADVEAHKDWLSRLPASAQAHFYTQAHRAERRASSEEEGNLGDNGHSTTKPTDRGIGHGIGLGMGNAPGSTGFSLPNVYGTPGNPGSLAAATTNPVAGIDISFLDEPFNTPVGSSAAGIPLSGLHGMNTTTAVGATNDLGGGPTSYAPTQAGNNNTHFDMGVNSMSFFDMGLADRRPDLLDNLDDNANGAGSFDLHSNNSGSGNATGTSFSTTFGTGRHGNVRSPLMHPTFLDPFRAQHHRPGHDLGVSLGGDSYSYGHNQGAEDEDEFLI
ncbi:hypothetical protein B0J18DRAFT_411007 [Chaetomium sp. MPI-SDFR-AT-0129]|nr:hypothetical protein B0J18DRAFT_411007 [Chaetomium sp. MPI-SDFR-AT-0129]